MQFDTVISHAARQTGAVLRDVQAGQLAAPTPCVDWDVRTLVNHVLQVGTALALAARGGPVPSELWTTELVDDSFAERFAADADAAAAGWAVAPAAPITFGAYEMPPATVASMLATDLTIHGWDLARATGQDYRPDPSAVDLSTRFMTEMGEQGRAMGAFGGPVPVAPDAGAFAAVLAASGRDPEWRPGSAP
ncbi:TIGR03086 family metal-binding protein [Asanoa sp. WMMD1127]|uniref:TIGR03086 family metal-binding protein n=1 Tax=Asanoa sp. WMMD1127 TaxID=3016107 RepID=UPI002415C7B0|nr:TIGR03086 family metal-binding protein [Asanoa sp. WMMD1127]MDG4825845.1 TIGR03086 family metal-binding protein [Asanoa sp. WMMD1127]